MIQIGFAYSEKLNLHCLLGSTTYLTQMDHEFALHLKNASGCGPC